MRLRRSGFYRNIGLLILRVGLGSVYTLQGIPILFGGPERWISHGAIVEQMGIGVEPMFFGFLAGITEFFGGLLLLAGLFYRQVLILFILVVLALMASYVGQGADYAMISHQLKMAIVFMSMIFIGPGKYSIDNRLNRRHRRLY